MFTRIYSTFFYMFVVFTLLAVATPLEGRWGSPPTNPTKTITVTAPGSTATEPASQCTTAQLQCCSSVEDANSPAATTLLGLLGIVLTDLTGLIGLGCSPLSVIGVGGGCASAHPVCCQNNAVGGLISVGCIPVSL